MRLLLALAFVFFACPAYAAGQALTKLDVIILDPGHGGEEAGAKAGDVLEKDVCYKLALAIKETVEKQNGTAVKVALTATPEKNADQRERAYIANSGKGKLFISLHAAAGFWQKPHGMGIYVPEIADVKTATWKEAGKRHSAKSAMFAERLKASLDAAFPGHQFFLGKGPLALFHGVAMPAVAVEAVDMNQPPAPEAIAKFAEAVYSALAEFDSGL